VKLGVLTTSFPRHRGDFAGCFVEDAVRVHAAAGDSVEVIAARPPPPGAAPPDLSPDLPSSVRVFGVHTPDCSGGPSPLFFGEGAPETLERRGMGAWVQAALFWGGLCEQIRARAHAWDRIVAHWLVPSALAARAVAPRLPLTAYAHSGDVALLERIVGGAQIARKLARETDELIFVSADLKSRFARLAGTAVGRVADVPRLRPLSVPHRGRVRELSEDSRQSSPQLIVLSVGRLVPVKGFDVLLRAVAVLPASGEAESDHSAAVSTGGPAVITVVILGEGPERVHLERLAQRLGVNVRLPGCVSRAEVARQMSAATVYIQPSRPLKSGRTEGMPTATLDAIDAGLPVIVSETGGLAELRSVTKVPADNVIALANSLANLLAQSGLRRSSSSANTAQG